VFRLRKGGRHHHVRARDRTAELHRGDRDLGKRFGGVIEYEEGPDRRGRNAPCARNSLTSTIWRWNTFTNSSRPAPPPATTCAPTGAKPAVYAELADEFKIGVAEPDDTGSARPAETKILRGRAPPVRSFLRPRTRSSHLGSLQAAVPRPSDDSNPRPSGPRGGLHRPPDRPSPRRTTRRAKPSTSTHRKRPFSPREISSSTSTAHGTQAAKETSPSSWSRGSSMRCAAGAWASKPRSPRRARDHRGQLCCSCAAITPGWSASSTVMPDKRPRCVSSRWR
jgi:hypothetical protein